MIEKHELAYPKLRSGQHHIGRYVILRQGALIEEECNEIEFWT